MAAVVRGPRVWGGSRDKDGQREWRISHRVRSEITDGPNTILEATGLPQPGDVWSFDDDVDTSAYCTFVAQVTMVTENEANEEWDVEQTFSTRPPNKCQDNKVEDPLLEPYEISGSFTKYQKEITNARLIQVGSRDPIEGGSVVNSAWEQIRGPQVEFDQNRITIKIHQNVADLQLSTIAGMVDTVNDDFLWGFPSRFIKLSNVSWERKFYGNCYVYYSRDLEFEIDWYTFDRDILDEGTKVIKGHWATNGNYVTDKINGADPDPLNPAHYIRFKDRHGENTRVILDGNGSPYNPNQAETEYWWCINNSFSPFTFFGTCSKAKQRAFLSGNGRMAGPFATEPLAAAPCLTSQYQNQTDSFRFACPGLINNTPGTIHIEAYGESNFLLLGIPLVIG